jgi:5-formyltetrahydrofolate cyclo-ligase
MAAARLEDFSRLTGGPYGIRALSNPDILAEPEELDIVLVPGLAFTAEGRRLGQGGGYYDRFLPFCSKALLVGAALPGQIIDELPCEEHDVKMDFLLSPGFLTDCGGPTRKRRE